MIAMSRCGARFSSISDGLTRAASRIATAIARHGRPEARRTDPEAEDQDAEPAPSAAIAGHGRSGAEARVKALPGHWPRRSRIAGTWTWSDL